MGYVTVLHQKWLRDACVRVISVKQKCEKNRKIELFLDESIMLEQTRFLRSFSFKKGS